MSYHNYTTSQEDSFLNELEEVIPPVLWDGLDGILESLATQIKEANEETSAVQAELDESNSKIQNLEAELAEAHARLQDLGG